MVHQAAAEAVFKALADPTRRQILGMLHSGELPAGELAAAFPISGPSISRHLAVLKAAGLVSERRQANRILYSLQPERLATAVVPWLSSVLPQDVLSSGPGKRQKKEKGSQKGNPKTRHGRGPAGLQPNGAKGGHSLPPIEVARPVTQANN